MKIGADDYIVATGATATEFAALPRISFTPEMAPEAYYGLAGRIVDAIDPYSEADKVATLMHLLVPIGNMIGPDAFARVQEDEHPTRLNVVMTGPTSKGRKGTAASTPKAMIRAIDEVYANTRIKSGLSSGEGVIWNVRDPREEMQPIKQNGRVVDYERVTVDEGERDKRLLIIEPEFASVLKRMNSESNSLSAVIRDAWDSGNLSTLTKNSPMRATRAHLSIIAHVTNEELVAQLNETEKANGFANRFLFMLVRRSKFLPEGGRVPQHVLAPLIAELQNVVKFARGCGVIQRDETARAIWADVYPELSKGEPGMLGSITSRAEAQVLRLSVLYALMDCSGTIRPEHLTAALAVWEYAKASAKVIFGGRLGLPVADTILRALRSRGEMTDTEINDLFKGHKKTDEIAIAMEQLSSLKLATSRSQATGGRPVTIWRPTLSPLIPPYSAVGTAPATLSPLSPPYSAPGALGDGAR